VTPRPSCSTTSSPKLAAIDSDLPLLETYISVGAEVIGAVEYEAALAGASPDGFGLTSDDSTFSTGGTTGNPGRDVA
jgi:hypothetical protein